MTDSFLPQDYEKPVDASRYLKLKEMEEGKIKLRILSSAVVGWEYWTTEEDGKKVPHRVKTKPEVPEEFINATENLKKARHFWAFVVYNYTTKEIQVLELTQKTIMSDLEDLLTNEDWGDPKEYDITLNKRKTGPEARDVEYSVMPGNKNVMDEAILTNYNELEINLDALYKNADPFGLDTTSTTAQS